MHPSQLSAVTGTHRAPPAPAGAAPAPTPAVPPEPLHGPAPSTPPSPLRQRLRQDMLLAGLAVETQIHYIGAVAALQQHYDQRPDKLLEAQVYQYLLWLRDQRQVPRGTFKVHYYGLRFFYYRFLAVDWPLFTRKKVRLPTRRRLPRVLAWEDGTRLLAAMRHPGYRLCGVCMLSLGLRISEAVTLTVGAIDSRQMVIRLVSKGNRERLLPLPPALLEALRTFWRTHRHPHWLFPNRAGTGTVDRQAVRHAFAAARDSLGLDRALTPHCLRHAWASTMLQHGTELRYLQLLLGHASLSSTEVYTHLTTPMQDQLRTQCNRLCQDLLPEGGRHV